VFFSILTESAAQKHRYNELPLLESCLAGRATLASIFATLRVPDFDFNQILLAGKILESRHKKLYQWRRAMEATAAKPKSEKDVSCWRGFQPGAWLTFIDVRDFIAPQRRSVFW
jgi:hypothetical protein